MYTGLLHLHNLLRWGVLIFGLYAIIQSVIGILQRREFTTAENRSHLLFVIFCHTQLLLGLVLYFMSPLIKAAMASGEVMKDAAYRFWAVEHISVMIIGILLVQIGRSLSKKETDTMKKHKKAVIFFSIGLLLILSRIPWDRAFLPGM
jgi:hypothetical protein